MPISKSKRNVRAASLGGLPGHPALTSPDPMLSYRMGDESPIRLPDPENQPSAATVLRSEYTITSDGAGQAVWGEFYNLLYAKATYAVTAGNTAGAVTTAHPQSTAFYAEARFARMVGMKIQVTYIGAEQTSAGYLSYTEKADTSDIGLQTVDNLHTGAQVQVKASDGLVCFVDYTQVPRWETPNLATFMQATFPIANFIATGLPFTTAVFRVRVARFMEYLPIEGSLAEGELLHEPHNPGALAAHAELSGTNTSVYTPSNSSAFLQKVKAVANAAYHMAQPMLPYAVSKARNYLVKNAGLKAGMLMLGM